MASFHLRRFANPSILKKIGQARLLRFLERHRDYLVGRRFPWPAPGTPDIEYAALAGIIAYPDDGMPARLVEALQAIDDLATPKGMERILARAQRLGIELELGDDMAPADVALDAWLKAEGMVIALHQEQVVSANRAFEYFASRRGPARLPGGMPERVLDIERMLAAWYVARQRGPKVTIQTDTQDRETLFILWHGESRHRDLAMTDDGHAVPISYRPSEYTLVAYHAATGELRVPAAALKGEKDLYRRAFGLCLFGSEDHFPAALVKYRLDPLQLDAAHALVCADVPGLDSVRLVGVSYHLASAQQEVIVHRVDHDLFAALSARGESLRDDRILEGRFKVRLEGSRTERSVIVRPPNVMRCGKEEDAPLVEQWLAKRGFTVPVRIEDAELATAS